VELKATSADRRVLDAVGHALAHSHMTRDFIPDHAGGKSVDLSFAAEPWQRLVSDRDRAMSSQEKATETEIPPGAHGRSPRHQPAQGRIRMCTSPSLSSQVSRRLVTTVNRL
jgi:hypothetical protein